MLFADLVGYTTYAEERDPEEVREFLTAYFDTVRETIASYGGRVEKFIGDAVMAVWGAPAAREDDTERAVRAGLELHAAVAVLGDRVGAPGMRIRAGAATGEAAVTRGLIGQGMVAGDVVNTAARLQAAAEPGALLVESATYRAARLSIAFEPIGPMEFRNKRRPVTAWRAMRVVAGRRGEGRANQLEPPFVGRAPELRAVIDRFTDAARDRRPHLVTVLGAAGTGKTRLAWELEKHLDGLALETHWHRATSPAYGQRLAYAALAEIVRQRAQIRTDMPAAARRHRLRACIRHLADDESHGRRLERALRPLVGLSNRPVESRDELFAGWYAFFAALAARRATVIVFDDTQLADDALLDFVDGLVEWPRTGPLLVVVLARPELLARRPEWGRAGRSRSTLDLRPIAARAMRRLLEAIAPGMPRADAARIAQRAQGIPLYAVELVRMLADRGQVVVRDGVYVPVESIEEGGLPETIHALLAARLDELEASDRAVVSDAAVVGTRFSMNALAAVSGRPRGQLEPVLDRLAGSQLVVQESRMSRGRSMTYRFADVAMREVAYATLSRRHRRSRHLAAASYHEAMEDPGQSGVVASHVLAAHRAGGQEPDATEVKRWAVRSLRRAAAHATELHAPEQALAYLDDALAIVSEPAQRAELWELAATAAESAARHDRAERFLRLAIRHHRRSGEDAHVVRLTARLGGVLLMRYQVGAALRLLRSTIQPIAAARAHDPEIVTVMARLARAYSLREERAAALEWSRRALDAARRHRLPGETAEALMTIGAELAFAGEMRRGLQTMRRAVATADRFELGVAGVRARVNVAAVLLFSDPHHALHEARTALELARGLGLRDLAVRALSVGAGDAALDTGDWSWASAALEEIDVDDLAPTDAIDIASGSHLVAAWRGDRRAETALQDLAARVEPGERLANAILAYRLAGVSLAAGDAPAAREHGERAIALLTAEGYRFAALSLGWSILARAGTWQRDVAAVGEALAAFEAHPLGSRWWMATHATLRAGILALEGDHRSASRAYAAARRRWAALRLPFRVALTRLDEAHAMGRDGSRALVAARAIFDGLGGERFVTTIDRHLDGVRSAGSGTESIA